MDFMSYCITVFEYCTLQKLITNYYDILQSGDHEGVWAQIYADECYEYFKEIKKKEYRIGKLC